MKVNEVTVSDIPRKPDRHGRFQPVGRCIYCRSNSSSLTDEHIVPYSLGGRTVLPKSSCTACAAITSKFEMFCARKMFGGVRLKGSFPSRKNRNRSGRTLVQTNLGLVEIDVSDMTAFCPMYRYSQAGILQEPKRYCETFECKIGGRSLNFDAALLDRNITEVRSPNFTPDPTIFALLLSKIAHCEAVAAFGYEGFKHFLPKYILQKDNRLPFVVGGMPGGEQKADYAYQSAWRFYGRQLENFAILNIRLFGYFGGPWAHVVVGKLPDATLRKMVKARNEKVLLRKRRINIERNLMGGRTIY